MRLRAATHYLFFGGAVFALGLVWHFPLERISGTLLNRLTEQTGYQLLMETLDPALPLGFEALNARLRGQGMEDLTLSRLRVTASPFALLTYPLRRTASLSFTAERDKNRWTGNVKLGRENLYVDIDTGDWRVDQSLPLQGMNPLLAGMAVKFTGRIELASFLDGKTAAVRKGDLSEASGKLYLLATQSVLEIPVLKEFHAATKQLRFDKIEVRAVLEKGKVDIQSISLMGPDVTGTGKGSLTLSPFFLRSRLDTELKLQITDKAPELREMIQNFGSQWGLRLDETGNVLLKITGPLTPVDRLRIQGA
jgi:type II secretion system protein N